MALNTSRSAARHTLRQWRSRPATPFLPSSSSTTTTTKFPASAASFSTTPCHLNNNNNNNRDSPVDGSRSMSTSSSSSSVPTEDLPGRWSFTPQRMKAPFSPHITKDPRRSQWTVNSDPRALDAALDAFLGRDGSRLLPEELKWLSVTHKSFDQGRRGFNDRLAYLGRQFCLLEVTQSILAPAGPAADAAAQHARTQGVRDRSRDPFGGRRKPFEDPALRTLNHLAVTHPADIFTMEKLAKVAVDTGLSEVVRWKPRLPENLMGSGFNPVMAGTLYSIVGAVLSQCGAKVASRVVRERILKRLR